MKRSADAPIQSPAKSLRLDAETIEDIRKIERRTGLNGESFAIATKQMSAIQSVNEQYISIYIFAVQLFSRRSNGQASNPVPVINHPSNQQRQSQFTPSPIRMMPSPQPIVITPIPSLASSEYSWADIDKTEPQEFKNDQQQQEQAVDLNLGMFWFFIQTPNIITMSSPNTHHVNLAIIPYIPDTVDLSHLAGMEFTILS